VAWKVYQDKAKVKKNIQIALFALAILLLLLMLGKVVSFFTAFNLPFTKSLAGEKSRAWDGTASYNLVYSSKSDDGKNLNQISLINFNPKDKKITVLHVSDTIYSELPREYGFWRVGSIYPLGEGEGEKRGVVLLKLSISKILGMPVDGIFISQKDLGKAEDVWSSQIKNPLSLITMLSDANTDLTPWEFVRLMQFATGVRSDKVISLDLSRTTITESKLLPDSTRVLGINYISLDSFIRDNLIDSVIYEENQTVGVFNATNQPGLAQDVSRLATNLGANVVIVNNAEKTIPKTVVVSSEDVSQESVTYERLSGIFAPNCLKQICVIDDARIKNSRAQINIVLGEDYYKYWYER
jgi:hypothetical protein